MSQNITQILNSMSSEKPHLSTLATKGDHELVQQFLTENVKVTGNESAQSQLYMASFWGIYEAVKAIVETQGVDVDHANPGSSWTPLHAASFQEHGKVVMFLLENGANPLAEDTYGRTPLDFASVSDKIWPLFAVKGLKRTPLGDLVTKSVMRQPHDGFMMNTASEDMDMNTLRKENTALVVNYDSHSNNVGGKDGRQAPPSRNRDLQAASIDGDVLAGDGSKDDVTEKQPNFGAWRN